MAVTGEVTGGEMRYALGENDQVAPTDGWGADVPAATDAGTYHVWYMVAGDGNHNDSTPVHVAVTIDRADSVPATVTASNPAYDGSEKPLVTVNASTLNGGTMLYALGADSETTPDDGWSEAIPTGTDVGTYHVWYKVVADANHNDSEAMCVTSTIAERAPNPSSSSASAHTSAPAPLLATEVAMLRVYNPWSGEHLYTDSMDEVRALETLGWRYEGVAWVSPKSSKTPVYRLYNSYSGDHHYTTGRGEYDRLQEGGWTGEGVGFYSDDARTVAVWRLFNPFVEVGTHHYTTGRAEYDGLPAFGWVQEGVGWYALR